MSQEWPKKGLTIVKVSEVSLPEPTTSSHARTRICLTKKLLCCVTLALVIVATLGIAIGVSLHNQASNNVTVNSPTTTATPAAQIASSTRTSTTNTHSATSIAPKASGTASTTCPATNGTTYSASGHTFLILCGNDIQAPKKVDMGRVYQPSFNACIESCAALGGVRRADISAVYWVDYNTEETGTCWCFGNTTRADGAYVSTWAANNLAWIQS